MRGPIFAAIAALLATSAGCVTHSHFEALSTESVPLLGYQLEGARRIPNVASEVRTQTFLWIPTSTQSPTLQAAIDGALRRGGGNVMVDVEVEHWWVFVPFLYGQEGWRVQGDVVRATGRE